MGQICSNPLQYLIENYGADVAKMITNKKAQEFIDEKVPEIKENASKGISQLQKKSLTDIDSQSQKVTELFDSHISDIQKENPSAIETVEATTGKKVSKIFGIDEVKNKFGDLKTTSGSVIGQVNGQIMSKIDSGVKKFKKQLSDQTPKLPLFENLSVCLQQRVLSEGEQKFAPEITAKKKEVSDALQNLSFEALSKQFQDKLPSNVAKNISTKAEEDFASAKRMIQNPTGGCGSCEIY